MNDRDFESLENDSTESIRNVDETDEILNDYEDIEIILAKTNPEAFIQYKKNLSKYASLGKIVESHIDNEKDKVPERQRLREDLLRLLRWQLRFFMTIFFFTVVYLALSKETEKLIELFKWFMIATLGEFIAIIFFVVKFLFNNNVEVFKHVKELITHDENNNL